MYVYKTKNHNFIFSSTLAGMDAGVQHQVKIHTHTLRHPYKSGRVRPINVP